MYPYSATITSATAFITPLASDFLLNLRITLRGAVLVLRSDQAAKGWMPKSFKRRNAVAFAMTWIVLLASSSGYLYSRRLLAHEPPCENFQSKWIPPSAGMTKKFTSKVEKFEDLPNTPSSRRMPGSKRLLVCWRTNRLAKISGPSGFRHPPE